MGLDDTWCLCICKNCNKKGAHYDDFCGNHAPVSSFGPEITRIKEQLRKEVQG